MNPDFQLIDINGLGYAAMYQQALSRLKHDGILTGGIHGALSSVLSAMQRHPDAMPVVIWDGHAQWRKDLFEGYKSSRSNDPDKLAIREAYERQVPYIQMMVSALGLPQIRCASAEADDLAGVLCRELDPEWQIELYTKDTDWWQALRPNVWWCSSSSKEVVDVNILSNPENNLSDGHFISPQEYLTAKALAGDSSDSIPGLKGVGLKKAATLLRAHEGSIHQFWEKVDAGMKLKGVAAEAAAPQEARELFLRNLKLMDWEQAPAINTHDLSLQAGEPDWRLAKGLSEDFGLSKVLQTAKMVLESKKDWKKRLCAVDSALHHNLLPPVQKNI